MTQILHISKIVFVVSRTLKIYNIAHIPGLIGSER